MSHPLADAPLGHDCPAKGCPKRLPMAVLACGPHWFQLPPALRQSISRAWRDGDLDVHAKLREKAVEILNPTALS